MSCNSLLSSTNADLARFYLLNEESGTTATDLSSAGDDGTYARDATNTTTTGPGGGYGLGQAFNGTSDLVTFGSAAAFTGAYTVAYWANRVYDSTFDFVLGHSTENTKFGFSDVQQNDMFIRLRPSGAFERPSTGVTTTAYHHYVAGRDASGDGFLYVDGGAVAVSLSGETGTANLDQIGKDDLGTNYHQGDIAAVALFDAELSATEAAQLAAGPEPIWLGTGTHHFNVARGTAYWNCPSTAWGLPTYLNAASTDNGSLTAEVRIVRDRGKATEAVVATTTGFSGSVACAGSTDNLTLELRVSNDGGYDDSLGDDADGWVSVAWYGLEAKLVGQWNLDEQSGDVARNQVRTLVLSEDFDSVGSTDSYGYLPAGWSRWAVGVTAGANASVAKTDEGFRVYLKYDGAGGDYLGASVSAPVSGTRYVLNAQVKVNAIVGATSELRCAIASGVWVTVVDSSTATGDWIDVVVDLGEANLTVMYLSAYSASGGGSVDVEVRNVTLYAENAATPTSDLSTLTTTGVVGRGCNLDGTDYISAPWDGGFTYPTSVGCAFKLDTLTSAANRALVSLADASVFDVQWAFGVASTGTNVFVMRRNPGASNQTPVAPLTTNWHTAVVVFHDETSYSIYLDGTLLTVQTGLTSISASANVDTLLVGLQRLTSPSGYADGITFDEVSAWTRELSAEDAAEWHQFTIFPLAARHSAEPLGLETSLSL